MTGAITAIPKFQFSSSTGAPLSGGTVTVSISGGSIPSPTWQDLAQTVLNTNPIVLDSRGEATIFLNQGVTYRFVLKNAAGVTQWTQDGISGTSGINSGRTVSNLAALKALDTAIYTSANTLGYTSTGDGGDAPYWYDFGSAEADDGFKVIAPDIGTGRWKLRPINGWYNVLQGGATRAGAATSTRLKACYDALAPGDKLYHPSPAAGTWYNLDTKIEVKDLDGVEIDFGIQKDIAIGGRFLNFKYTGSTLTDKYDAVIKLVGLVGSQVYGACVNVDNKAKCGIWFSGTNFYDGSVTTSNRRSSNCQFHDCYVIGVTATGTDNCAIIIGEDEGGNASQTDLLTIWNLKGAGGETGAAVDTTPVTYGMQILGLNTYVTNKGECELTGDCGLYVSGNVSGERFYCLNNSVAGLIVGSANASVVLNALYMEGLVGRPVQTYVGAPSNGETAGSRPIVFTGMIALPGGAGPTYEAYFTSNQNVVMTGCFLKGWKTDNHASANERPFYAMSANKYFDPITDNTHNPSIKGFEFSTRSNGTVDQTYCWTHADRMSVADYTSGPTVLDDGVTEGHYIGVNSGAGNTITLSNAIKGDGPIHVWRTGAGTLVVKAKAGDTIIRHDTGVAAATDCRLATAGEYGCVKFYCLANDAWRVESTLTITYT